MPILIITVAVAGWIYSCRIISPFCYYSGNIPRILRVYDNVRRPFSQDVQQCSRDTGLIYELRSSGSESITVEDS